MTKLTKKKKAKFVGKYFSDIGFSDDDILNVLEKYHEDYIVDTMIFCEKKEKSNKKYFMLALKNAYALKQAVNNFEDKIVKDIKKTLKPKTKKSSKLKAKTLTEKELVVLNAPTKTYGMDGYQRSCMFKIAQEIGMNTFALYNLVELHGFTYVYENYLQCYDRDKLNGPAYFIAAVKNDYWNLKDYRVLEKDYLDEKAIPHQESFNNTPCPEQFH